jgi:hypothetical protein
MVLRILHEVKLNGTTKEIYSIYERRGTDGKGRIGQRADLWIGPSYDLYLYMFSYCDLESVKEANA